MTVPINSVAQNLIDTMQTQSAQLPQSRPSSEVSLAEGGGVSQTAEAHQVPAMQFDIVGQAQSALGGGIGQRLEQLFKNGGTDSVKSPFDANMGEKAIKTARDDFLQSSPYKSLSTNSDEQLRMNAEELGRSTLLMTVAGRAIGSIVSTTRLLISQQ